MRKIRPLILILLVVGIWCVGLLGTSPSGAAEEIRMASVREENTVDGLALKLVYIDAFQRIGKELVYLYYPPKRTSLMANSGQVDGELARGARYNGKFPNLVKVTEPIITIRISGFVVDPTIQLRGWESLVDTPYRIDYMRGQLGIQNRLQMVARPESITAVSHWLQGLRKLASGRTDIYIGIERTLQAALSSPKLKLTGISHCCVFEEQTIHAYLHKRHRHLVDPLSGVLKEMKKAGLIETYIQTARQELNP